MRVSGEEGPQRSSPRQKETGVFEDIVVTLQHAPLVRAHVEDSELAYFATAMVMAASFEPLKRRIDALVERRWFRKTDGTAKQPANS